MCRAVEIRTDAFRAVDPDSQIVFTKLVKSIIDRYCSSMWATPQIPHLKSIFCTIWSQKNSCSILKLIIQELSSTFKILVQAITYMHFHIICIF